MEKKSILRIIIIVILLIIVGMVIFTNFSNSNEIKVGDVYFEIPDNYVKGDLNKDGDITITNGKNSVYLSDCKNDAQTNVNDYLTGIQKRNLTLQTSSFNVNGINVDKISVGNDTNTTHYWFTINEKVYTIYSWDINNNLDDTVTELIESSHT